MNNMATWMVGGVVLLAAALAFRSLYKDKKAGKACGCCGDCSKCGGCR